MPAAHKSFLFKHFDKLICGVVGLTLVVAIVYGVRRVTGGKVENVTSEIETLTAKLKEQMEANPPEVSVTNYVEKWRAAREVGDPGEVQEIFWYPWPVYYEERRLAINQDYRLQFQEPLAPKSVEVEEENPEGEVVKNVVHPVGVDYSMVEVVTGNIELGEAIISGRVGKTTHRMPIVVDEEVRERAKPPVDVSAKAVKGGITLRWNANPENTEAIDLDEYEIYRKRARKVSGKFVKVGTIKAESGKVDTEETDGKSETSGYHYTWKDESFDLSNGNDEEAIDRGVRPGETYLYKVRSIARNSEPPTSEFSPLVRATTLPTVDFQFSGQSGDTVRFKVRVYKDGYVYQERCGVRVGEEIGVFVDDEKEGIKNFLTDCYLLDFHSEALRRDPFARGRVIILNRRGQIEERWRNETQVEYLWQTDPGDAVDKKEEEAGSSDSTPRTVDPTRRRRGY